MMAQVNQLPRPLLIALAATAVAAVLMVATRGGGTSSPSSSPATPAQTTGTPSATGSSPTTGTAGQGGTPAAGQPKPRTVPRTLPAPVDRALDAKKVVVLLFWNPDGSDDRSVRQSLTEVSSRGGKVAKFNDTLGNLARYTRITGTQSVTQTPAVVVVDKQGNGQVATGFLDTTTVDQLVVNALRN